MTRALSGLDCFPLVVNIKNGPMINILIKCDRLKKPDSFMIINQGSSYEY